MVDAVVEGLWGILKSVNGRIRYSFLSRNQKVEFNLGQLQKKYWFEQLVKESPSIIQLIKNDDELKVYVISRGKLRKVMHNSSTRKSFKEIINRKLSQE